MKKILLFLILFTSCSSPYLNVRTERIDESYLASSYIDIPNLCVQTFCGEQLVIHYRASCLPASLHLSLRFADHQVVTLTRDVTTRSGYWLYRLMNEQYCNQGPIISYKVELYEAGILSKTFSHLWADLIEI